MAFPVTGKNLGSGIDQLKAQIVGWIRDEIRASQRGGIGVPLIGGVGSLGNDALTTPVISGAGGNFVTNFAVSATSTAVVSVSLAIPAGFTQTLVHVTVGALAQNASVGIDSLYVRAAITLPGGAVTNGSELSSPTTAVNAFAPGFGSLAAVFTGLSPGSITVACKVRGAANWTANVANVANVDASIVFLR